MRCLILFLTVCVPIRPCPPPRHEPPVPITLAGQWRSSHGIIYDVTQQGPWVRMANDSWPADGVLVGATLRLTWRNPGGDPVYGGEYRLSGGVLSGHYWSCDGGRWTAETINRATR